MTAINIRGARWRVLEKHIFCQKYLILFPLGATEFLNTHDYYMHVMYIHDFYTFMYM